MLLYSLTRCLVLNLVMICGSRGSSVLSDCCGTVHMQSVGEESNAYKGSLHWIVQMWDQKQMLFILLYGFLLEFLELHRSMSIFNSKFHHAGCQSSNMQESR